MWESRNPRYPGLVPADMRLDFAELIRQKDALIDEYRGKKYHSILDERTVDGLDEVPFLTSDLLTWGEDQELKELPRSLVIVGGG